MPSLNEIQNGIIARIMDYNPDLSVMKPDGYGGEYDVDVVLLPSRMPEPYDGSDLPSVETRWLIRMYEGAKSETLQGWESVSYTHLTLPTKA